MKRKNTTKLLNAILMLACSLLITVTAKAQTYCVPTFTSGCDGTNPWYNDSIKLNTLDWHTGASCSTYDYTSTSTALTAGTTYTMSVTSGVYTGCTVWIDLNGNGSFADPGENFYHMYTAAPMPGYETYTFTLTLPSCTHSGSYRMRVLAGWGTDGYTVGSMNGWGSCGDVDTPYLYGNFDDFTLVVTGDTVCDTPTALTAVTADTTSATFKWTPAPCSGGSEYVLTTSPAAPTGAGTVTYDTFKTFTGLTSGETYYLHLLTKCGPTDSSGWIDVPVTTLSGCGEPASPAVTGITPTSAAISWTSPASGTVAAYQYVLGTTIGTPTGSGTSTPTTSYAASSLTPGTTYYFYIRTICSSGDSSAWRLDSFTTPFPCDPPTGLTTSGITSSAATIAWLAPGGATAGSYQYVISTSATAPTAPGTTIPASTTYTATGLLAGTSYYFYIRTMCTDGDSSAWVSEPFTTLAPCNEPLTLLTADLFSSFVTFTWASPGGAFIAHYEYTLDETAAAPSVPGTSTSSTSYTATGLTPLTSYYFHIRSVCLDGESSPWETLPFQTPAPCDTPTILTQDITFQGVHIVWTSVDSAVQYQYVLNNDAATPTVPGTATTDTEYNLIGLVPLTTYYFHLSVVCIGGSSPWTLTTFATPYNNTGVVNVNGNDGLNINVAPNPAKDFVTISLYGTPSGTATIQLTDMEGRMLQSITMNSNTTTLDLSGLPQGMYFVRYSDDVNKQTVKLIK